MVKKKRKIVKKSIAKRKVVKKKVATKKSVKRRVKKKVRKTNPVKGHHYVAFITSGKKSVKFYYHGINFKTKGLKFSSGANTTIVFTTRSSAIKFVEDMIKIFVPEQRKELFPVGAELIHPKR